MNSVYPSNHFGYSGPGGPSGPGGGGPGPGGFPGTPRNAGPGGPHSPMLNTGKMGVNVNTMNVMSRVGGISQQQQGGQAGGEDEQAKVCAGCGVRIVEKTLLHSMERYWHESCLRCTCCGTNLADSASCFIKSGMILCKPDYVRMFGHCGVCAACGQGIPASEFVMRVGGGLVYHIRCFSCSKCNTTLARGDRYLLVNGAPVCEQDANKLFPPVKKGKVGRPRRQRD